jgi:curved DNA-binding protein
VHANVTVDFRDAVLGTTLPLKLSNGESVTVRVPPGVSDGERVRVRGRGAPGMSGGPRGDMVLTIKVKAHPLFERDGDDLWLELPITIAEAYRGAQIRVPTPHGGVKLSVPAGAQGGQKMRLRGKGIQRRGREPGDLYVRFVVRYPTDDDPEVEGAIDKLADKVVDPRKDIRF